MFRFSGKVAIITGKNLKFLLRKSFTYFVPEILTTLSNLAIYSVALATLKRITLAATLQYASRKLSLRLEQRYW